MNIHVAVTSFVRFCLCFSFLVFCAAQLTACDALRSELRHDREGGKEFQDYRDAMAPRLPDPDEGVKEATAGSIPELQAYVATPGSEMETMPLVSISVNQSVSLRDVLFELAKQADYDLELDPRITGSIIFTARERPFDQVIARICDISGLRYRFQDDVLRVELDTAYNKTYKIDYLNYVRTNSGSISNNIAVVTGDGADTGSQFEAATESEADFWGELEQNLKQILGGSVSGALKTKKTPKISSTEQDSQSGDSAPEAAAGAEGTNSADTDKADADADKDAEASDEPQPPAMVTIQSIPEEDEDSTASDAADSTASYTFTINKQAGMVSVFASDKAHKEIEQYLKLVRRSVMSQVLIEAKVLQIELKDEYAAGVDWSHIAPIIDDRLEFDINGTGLPALIDGPTTTNFSVTLTTDDLTAAIEAVSRYGTVKALASPRLTVLNNQSAVLNVATNHVYFEIDIDITSATTETPAETKIESEAHNVPIGLIVNVQPSINLDNNTITLAVRPTITRIESEVQDPGVAYIAQSTDVDIESSIPELNVQEIDSVLQVRSGQAIVMGGLLQDRVDSQDEGIPILSEAPLVGSLFKQHRDLIKKTELVIFLKATILKAPEDSVHSTDRDLYRKFSGDRRPLRL